MINQNPNDMLKRILHPLLWKKIFKWNIQFGRNTIQMIEIPLSNVFGVLNIPDETS